MLRLVLLTVAVQRLPWWGSLVTIAGVIGGLYLLLHYAAGRMIRALFLMPFKAKGAVLRGASAEVHAIEPAPAPEREADEEEGGPDEGPAPSYYRIDVTITPRRPTGPFQLWEPGELMLMPAGARPSLDDDGPGAGVSEVEVFQDGAFAPDEGMKYPGPRRVRLLVGVPPELGRRVQFRYYFEAFGPFELPAGAGGS